MARKVVTELTDDIDGTQAVATVTFGYQGRLYEIDLNQKNVDRLQKALARFIEHGRTVRAVRAGGRQGQRRGVASTAHTTDTKTIRQWARGRGLQVSERGRIPAEIMERYKRDRT